DRHAVGQDVSGMRGNDVPRLVRMEHENIAATQLIGPIFDAADACIAVFQWAREVASLKRCAHAIVFADRDPALKDERFGSAADRAVLRADLNLAGCRRAEALGPNLASARSGDPEGARAVVHGSNTNGF